MYLYMSVCIGHGRPLSGSVPAILQKAGHQASLQGPAPNHRAKDGAIWLGAMGDVGKRWLEYTVYIICLRYIFKKEHQQKIKTWNSNSSWWILLFYLVLGLLYIYIICIYIYFQRYIVCQFFTWQNYLCYKSNLRNTIILVPYDLSSVKHHVNHVYNLFLWAIYTIAIC